MRRQADTHESPLQLRLVSVSDSKPLIIQGLKGPHASGGSTRNHLDRKDFVCRSGPITSCRSTRDGDAPAICRHMRDDRMRSEQLTGFALAGSMSSISLRTRRGTDHCVRSLAAVLPSARPAASGSAPRRKPGGWRSLFAQYLLKIFMQAASSRFLGGDGKRVEQPQRQAFSRAILGQFVVAGPCPGPTIERTPEPGRPHPPDDQAIRISVQSENTGFGVVSASEHICTYRKNLQRVGSAPPSNPTHQNGFTSHRSAKLTV